jgi:hypothetical protein
VPKLERLERVLSVSSEPPGATVVLDGRVRGKTPMDVTGVVFRKTHRLQLRLRGHKTHEQTISGAGGWQASGDKEVQSVAAKLEKETRPVPAAPVRRPKAPATKAPKAGDDASPPVPTPPPTEGVKPPENPPPPPAPKAEPKDKPKDDSGLKTPSWGD